MNADAECGVGAIVIEPEIGFQVVGPYGSQRCGEGVNERLLRLDEALHWMMHKKELPKDKSIYAVFSPLIQWDEADSKYRRQVLYVLNHEGYAYTLSLGDKLNPAAVDIWGDMPFSYSHTYSMGTVREIAETWRDSWPGYVENADSFYRAGWVNYCKAMKKLAKASELPRLWESKYREDYFINLDDWKERCKRFVRSLSRLAVPVSVAHELWGWGSVAQPDVLPSATAAPVMEAQDVIDWPSLVQNHKALFTSPGAWPTHWRRIALEFHEFGHGARRGATTKKQMAGALGVSRDTVETLLNAAVKDRVEESSRRLMPGAVVNVS